MGARAWPYWGLLLCLGCAESPAESSPREIDASLSYRGPITLWNRSQFPLDEVRVHRSAAYIGAANILTRPLASGETLVVQLPPDGRVTVIRAKVEGGRPWAISTPRPVAAQSSAFVLVVFDDGFLETSYGEVMDLDGFPATAPPVDAMDAGFDG